MIDMELIKLEARKELARREFFYFCNLLAPDFYKVNNLEWATFKEQNEHFYKKNLKSEKNIQKAVKAMNKANAKKTRCLNTGEIYKSASEAGKQIGISGSAIMRCCRGESKSAGKDENGKPLKWEYV